HPPLHPSLSSLLPPPPTPPLFPYTTLFRSISLAHPLELTCTPETDVWSFPIVTVSKSERGLDETVQGRSLTPRWPAAQGEARIEDWKSTRLNSSHRTISYAVFCLKKKKTRE